MVFRWGWDPDFPKPSEKALGGIGGGSTQLRGPLQCLWLWGVEDKDQVPRRLPRAEWVAQHQMDFPLLYTRGTIPWLPLLYLPSLLYLQDLHGQRVSLEVALEDRGGP